MSAPPYSLLAAGYDAVMEHVDYPFWAEHVQRIVEAHRPGATSVVELGCGTGALAEGLQPLGPAPAGYAYRAYDGSPAMVAAARASTRSPVTFGVLDFRDPVPGPPADVVLLLYDGLNYLLDPVDVSVLLGRVADALAPGGIAVLDQSTPANSLNHADGFDDAGLTEAFAFERTSRFDAATGLHTTTFRLTGPDGRTETETHVQRAYTLAEVRALIAASPLAERAAYADFSLRRAGPATERVHWVLGRRGE
ncbi:MAG TPA: class I SAM-dependent methyltransferase [Rubricoccaceae bacterium]|jgi:SAM-dependent methyltransferase